MYVNGGTAITGGTLVATGTNSVFMGLAAFTLVGAGMALRRSAPTLERVIKFVRQK